MDVAGQSKALKTVSAMKYLANCVVLRSRFQMYPYLLICILLSLFQSTILFTFFFTLVANIIYYNL